MALEQMEYWDAKEKTSRLSLEELEARNEAKEEYKKWVLLEEITWRQKSREVWLKEGDRNTGFFHKMANAHRRRNNVDRIKINGAWLTEENDIREGIANAFKTLLSNPGDWRPSVSRLQFEMLEQLDANALETPLWKRRPISLVGSLYKWLAKVLANRLKKVVGKVVSKAQGAFVEGRQILDAMLIANEAIDSTLKNNESGILCKLDIEKAGLRQGDPLSPYLFVIAMEVFSVFIKRAVEGDFLSGCRVKGRSEEGVLISHLLFADDTLVFCKPSQDQLTYLSWLLMWFEAVSRLRINLEKSELIPVGRVESMDDLVGDFGCSLGSLPTTYLGMPLGASFKSVTVWDGVEERFRRRLSMWKRQYLSKGGTATLIRSTLSNLPIYLMSLLCLPSSVRRRLEKIQRDFLWGGGNLDHKPHLVRWELVCLSKAKGGLGVKSLSLLNKTLLAKWNWRFANEREALWNQVIRGKYGEARGGWCSREVREAHGLGLWKGIRMGWKMVSDRLAFIVGNGRRVSFWRDRWCGESPLSFNDWEIEEAERFMERIQSKRVFEDVEDTVSWTETKSAQDKLLRMGGYVGKSLNIGFSPEKRMGLGEQMFYVS
ncbi:putative ribonuclease H protein [Vitis vinifera]|uniref:Putative ribonuclease H protein n=1 Tax=Vitis vinifera TaxID=29760 RepID=A0A438G5Z4_VITVI|nr:putative ribonuclease H protein [Vitis vinifera]